MAKSREIVKRRKSVNNIRKITKTMEMIATSRYKKTYSTAVHSRPYTNEISKLVSTLSDSGSAATHPLLKRNDGVGVTVLLVLTSNRGLCGGYNSQVIRNALVTIAQLERAGERVELHVSGKKGIGYFRFIRRTPSASYTCFGDDLTYAAVETLADELIGLYEKKEISAVRVVYTDLISTSQYGANMKELLPFQRRTESLVDQRSVIRPEEYIFSPSAGELFSELVPMAIRSELYQCFLDSVVTEHMARRRAMTAATDNAEQMNQMLTQQYNRARQSQITSELLDILGGVEALN